jgi:predicted PurR-regulated permease PerM
LRGKFSSDLLAMLVAAAGFTVFGWATGATFITILCGACLGLILIEVVTTLRRRGPVH